MIVESTLRQDPDGTGRFRPVGLLDALIVLLILAAWLPAAWWITGGKRVVWYDTFRDMAWAENMLAGRLWADPVVSGQTWWYAPGGPLLATGLARLTGRSVADVYGTSPLWWNAWIPVAVYLLARLAWGRGMALLSLATVFLGSYWWYTHVAAPIPGIQAVPLMLLVLALWHLSATRDRGRLWAIMTGTLLAACTWWHPVCGIVAALTIAFHAAYDALRRPPRSRAGAAISITARTPLLQRMLIVAAVSASLTSPLIVHMFAIHARDPYLLQFSAPEIAHPAFYAQAHTPLIVPAALLGVWAILRYAPQTFWAVAYFLATLLLQLPAYLAHSKHWEIPYLLPHEMQWHMQLAEGLCAAVGLVWLGRELARLASKPRLAAYCAVLLAVIAVGPALRQSLQRDQYYIDLDQLLDHTRETRAWIQSHTALQDTIACGPELGFKLVSGLTGRKCIAVSHGHMNPTPDAVRRYYMASERLPANDPTAALATCRQYGAHYLFYMFHSPERAAVLSKPCDACPALERCFISTDGSARIYRIRPEAPR